MYYDVMIWFRYFNKIDQFYKLEYAKEPQLNSLKFIPNMFASTGSSIKILEEKKVQALIHTHVKKYR